MATTAPSIDEQVQAIRRATALATESKAAAMKFLVDAGIIKAGNNAMSGNINHQANKGSQKKSNKK